jgi:hypothetical protein
MMRFPRRRDAEIMTDGCPKRAKILPVRFVVRLLCLFPAAIFAKTGLGVDVDFYTGPISINVWGHLKATNQKFVIAQSWGGRSRNEFASSQLAGARSAGMKTAAYILLITTTWCARRLLVPSVTNEGDVWVI